MLRGQVWTSKLAKEVLWASFRVMTMQIGGRRCRDNCRSIGDGVDEERFSHPRSQVMRYPFPGALPSISMLNGLRRGRGMCSLLLGYRLPGRSVEDGTSTFKHNMSLSLPCPVSCGNRFSSASSGCGRPGWARGCVGCKMRSLGCGDAVQSW